MSVQQTDEPTMVEVVKESKSGFKTTEFWLTVITLVALNSGDVILTLPDKYQAFASALVAAVYALSRGLAKKSVPDIEVQTPPSA